MFPSRAFTRPASPVPKSQRPHASTPRVDARWRSAPGRRELHGPDAGKVEPALETRADESRVVDAPVPSRDVDDERRRVLEDRLPRRRLRPQAPPAPLAPVSAHDAALAGRERARVVALAVPDHLEASGLAEHAAPHPGRRR